MPPPSPIIIAGAGAAGIACAIASARLGRKVLLLEQSGQLGGTVVQALIHTLGGLFDDQGNILNPGLAAELAERLAAADALTCKRRLGKTWILNADPGVYRRVVGQWIVEHPAIEVCYHTTVERVSIQLGRIDEVTCGGRVLNPCALIDTTGQAAVVRGIAAGLASEGSALSGVIAQIRGVAPGSLQFPKSVGLLRQIRKASQAGQLPPECASLWLDAGVHPDEAYAKFNLPGEAYDPLRMAAASAQLLAFLAELPGFSGAFLSALGQLGVRDGGQVRGEYTLTEADLRAGRRFDDAVCEACWPIEYWHPQEGVSLDYFPPGHRYQIPFRALKVHGVDNLFTAGKCLSAEPLAQASARVVGTCWAMGEGLAQSIF